MNPERTVVFRALRRALLAGLGVLTFVGGTAIWGLWTEGRHLEQLGVEAPAVTTALAEVRQGLSAFEISLLRFMEYLDQDLSGARDSLARVRHGLAALSRRSRDPSLAAVRTGVAALERGLRDLEAADESLEQLEALDAAFRDLSGRAHRLDAQVARLFAQHLDAHRDAGAEASEAAARVQLCVGVGTVLGWLLLLFAIVFAWRRLQNPFREVLAFVRAAGERNLADDLAASRSDEIGALADAAHRLRGTLVDTLGTLRRVAEEARDRGVALQSNAVGARHGAERQLEQVGHGAERAREIEATLVPLTSLSGELRTGAERAASSVQQILAMTEEVRAEMEALSRRVGTSTRSVEQLSEATGRVAAVAAQLGSAAQTVAASALMIDASTDTLHSVATEGRGLAEDVVGHAAEGRRSMVDALEGMARIQRSVDAAVRSFERLEGELGRVGRVTQVIDDIAARTNLLSLNAAIIAAQAGDQGHAFGVVATEIRTLAEKTAANTREIRAIVEGLAAGGREAAEAISDGASRVGEGEGMVRKTDALLATIYESADHAARRLRDVEEAAQGQAEEAGRVAEEIQQVSTGVVEIVAEVQHQEARMRQIHEDLSEMENGALQVARASEEQTRGTEMITHAMVEVSHGSERVDQAIARVGDLLTALRQDLEALGDRARDELQRVASVEVEGEGLAALAGELQAELAPFRLPARGEETG